MANIAETLEIVANTPEEQAILLKGIHGVGKSESIRDGLVALGYRMVTIFLGQAADAGDIVGLPDKIEMEFNIGGEMVKHRVTDFDPPKWWPFDMNDKVVIFFDEVNRGKPEIMQCIMDMVLNRKLNGRDLPSHTRIIAAMNPMDDGYYQVEDLDPALLDRFNVYDFTPTNEEWIEWATSENGQVHEYVIRFIAKHGDMLDPPSSKEAKVGEVYPSRRSWVRVSNVIKRNEKLLAGNREVLNNLIRGIVGVKAQSAFNKFINEIGSGLSPELIMTKFDKKIEEKVKKMNISEAIHMNGQIAIWLEDHTATLEKKSEIARSTALMENLEKYMNATHVEAQASFLKTLGDSNKNKKKWPRLVLSLNKTLTNKFQASYRGETFN